MKEKDIKRIVVMAIAPRTRGFGYVVFHGPSAPHRWGAPEIRVNKNRNSLLKIEELAVQHSPDVIVIEDYAGEGSRRAERIETLIDDIAALAVKKKIKVHRYSRAMIRECFSEFDAFTKYEIAVALAKSLSQFAPQLPPKRKLWLPEVPRMSIFDAAALVFSFFYFDTKKKLTA